jgi:DNA-K related protein
MSSILSLLESSSSVRSAKEAAFFENNIATTKKEVQIVSDSSDLFSSVRSIDVDFSELKEIIDEEFFPICSLDTKPLSTRSGLREIGLIYAADTRVTSYLANFLSDFFYSNSNYSESNQSRAIIDGVLFVGGTLIPSSFRRRILTAISSWQLGAIPLELSSKDLQLSVSRGACLYSLQRSNQKQKIKAGYRSNILLEIKDILGEDLLVCILPKGSEAGYSFSYEREFMVKLGSDLLLTLYTVSDNKTYSEGVVYKRADLGELVLLPHLKTHLSCSLKERGARIKVSLSIELNSLGLLEFVLTEVVSERSWSLKFNLRDYKDNSLRNDNLRTFSESGLLHINEVISRYWGKASKDLACASVSPKKVLLEIEKAAGLQLANWSVAMLRSAWPALYSGLTRRNRSLEHELYLLRLAGLFLRPGYGFNLDEERIEQLWKLKDLGLVNRKNKNVSASWFIMWRRVVGGLDTSKQLSLYEGYSGLLSSESEVLKLLASCERLSPTLKKRMVRSLLNLVYRSGKTDPSLNWSLKRLMNRVPVYAAEGFILESEYLEELISEFLKVKLPEVTFRSLLISFCEACRYVDNPLLDVSFKTRKALLSEASKFKLGEKVTSALMRRSLIDNNPRNDLLGDTLPDGMVLL